MIDRPFDYEAWVRLYEMRLATGAGIEAACRFANEQLGYPVGPKPGVPAWI